MRYTQSTRNGEKTVKIPRWAKYPEKMFYIYAILLGPQWTKNLTTFMIWFISIAILLIHAMWKSEGPSMIGDGIIYSTKDKDSEPWHISLTKERHWTLHFLSVATVIVLAAMHWWWTGALYIIASLSWWVFTDDVKKAITALKKETDGAE